MDFGGTVPFTVNFFLQKKRLPKLTSIDKPDGIFIQTILRERNKSTEMGPTMAPPVQLRSFGSLSNWKWCNSAASALFTERPRMDISEHSFKGRNDCMSLLFVAVQFGKLLSARQENLFFFGGGREWNLWPKWHRFKTVWRFDEIVKKNLVRRCKKYQELYDNPYH